MTVDETTPPRGGASRKEPGLPWSPGQLDGCRWAWTAGGTTFLKLLFVTTVWRLPYYAGLECLLTGLSCPQCSVAICRMSVSGFSPAFSPPCG